MSGPRKLTPEEAAEIPALVTAKPGDPLPPLFAERTKQIIAAAEAHLAIAPPDCDCLTCWANRNA